MGGADDNVVERGVVTPEDQELELAAKRLFEQSVTEDHFDEKYTTSRWEIWSYYLCYVGNVSIPGNYSSTSESPLPRVAVHPSHRCTFLIVC